MEQSKLLESEQEQSPSAWGKGKSGEVMYKIKSVFHDLNGGFGNEIAFYHLIYIEIMSS